MWNSPCCRLFTVNHPRFRAAQRWRPSSQTSVSWQPNTARKSEKFSIIYLRVWFYITSDCVYANSVSVHLCELHGVVIFRRFWCFRQAIKIDYAPTTNRRWDKWCSFNGFKMNIEFWRVYSFTVKNVICFIDYRVRSKKTHFFRWNKKCSTCQSKIQVAPDAVNIYSSSWIFVFFFLFLRKLNEQSAYITKLENSLRCHRYSFNTVYVLLNCTL